MKVAITATGNTLTSELDDRFGRCTYFAIHDTNENTTEFILNPNKESPEGAGPASVQLVASKGAKQIISGEFGGKVRTILEQLEIQMVMFSGPKRTIKEIITLINNN